ncbi:MAG: pantetheine-phosphate adenylyltransferase [Nitrospirae bacterium CG_4_10_14_0_8_um_filter_41_23]|nr:pantetheine-phosphate adenylyltransferase [Nitrospirota bacterium]OIP61102.1 MAG: pantetheine-phosphate adenylyltransferase [Nitrospirae bacterium CG2_30_41_42]PIQ93813.1 MAG: pantetheine-phosphate adenylyltransferase [Nitrospirae bacterium CG11_big_fil_rev_8_21_14_0_20_41_14]PIV42415.1 MAG: pantetheine-phosphate adenylyltransferase [Nitrospirae bacterium CG02_land_8_20_14_3_00_41_53]PIW88320.1 MAG: pantetheine-phosphate adenylyltransferase [Nitrospirae bacterium CG_4_8_14_3_um_filter_41_47]
MKKIAIYPGTFDPITNGHLDLVKRGLMIFDEVIIAVAPSYRKQPLFTLKERLKMIRYALKRFKRVRVESFNGLLIEYVRKKKGIAILRGLRAVSDFEYELQMAHMNRRLDTNIETVFMMPSEEYSFLTSSMVKEIASYGGSVKGLVTDDVENALREKFKVIVEDIVE